MKKKLFAMLLTTAMAVGIVFAKAAPVGAETAAGTGEKITSAAVSKIPYEDSIKDANGEAIMSITLEQPVLEGASEGIAAINQFFKSEFEAQKLAAHSSEFYEGLTAERPGSFLAAYEVTYNRKGIICLLLTTYTYTGGAHGMPDKIGYTFDLNTGKLLKAKDLFALDNAQFKKLISNKFKKTFAKAPALYFPDALKTVKSSASLDKTPFYLKDTNVCFYYPPYELAPYSTGFVSVGFSYGQTAWFKISLE